MSTITFTEPQSFAARQPLTRRIAPRRKVAVPLNVTILRSGVPDAVPGRSLDVGEGGIGAVLAAEVFPGELVGVEFRLPDSTPVLAKARVCYQERLRCGLQFLSIPPDQREMLEAWSLDIPKRTAQTIAAPKTPVAARQVHRAEAPLPKFLADPDPALQFRVMESMRAVSGHDYGDNVEAWQQYAKTGHTEKSEIDMAERVRRYFR
jgi:hypothetical protein